MSNGPRLGNLSPAGAVAIGILVGLLSTCIQSIGLTLQRKSHLLEDEKHDKHTRIREAGRDSDRHGSSPYRPAYRRRRWQIGMGMFVIANLVGSTIQITTLPLPVLSTLQASGLVFNTLCASLLLHERFTRWSFIGTALVAGGAVLIAMYGAMAEPSHNLTQLLELLGRRQFILWMFGTFLLIACILVGVFILNRIQPHSHSHGLRVARGFAHGGISAILSAHSLLVAKSAVELLVRTIIDKKNQFNRWQSWIILLALIFFALTQLYFLHRGLKLVSTSILYPFVFCVYNIIAILDGLIYFRQTDRLPPLHGGLIALGTVILLSGVLALSWRTEEDTDTPPPADAHTLLTPGMGLVEDTTTEDERDTDIDEDNASITSADDEARLMPSETTPLLSNGNGHGLKVAASSKAQAPTLLIPKSRSRNGAELLESPADIEDISAPAPTLAHQSRTSPKHKRNRSDDLHALPRRLQKSPRISHTSAQPDLKTQDTSRTSSPSPSPHPNAMSRASTIHNPTDPTRESILPHLRPSHPSPLNTLTWRERDREMRRLHRWPMPRRLQFRTPSDDAVGQHLLGRRPGSSSIGGADGVSGEGSRVNGRGRSASTPFAFAPFSPIGGRRRRSMRSASGRLGPAATGGVGGEHVDGGGLGEVNTSPVAAAGGSQGSSKRRWSTWVGRLFSESATRGSDTGNSGTPRR